MLGRRFCSSSPERAKSEPDQGSTETVIGGFPLFPGWLLCLSRTRFHAETSKHKEAGAWINPGKVAVAIGPSARRLG